MTLLQSRRWYLGTAAIYAVVAAAVAVISYPLLNADGVSYIQIARHYAAGDLELAVNSYWGPLVSWLLLPGVAAGLDPIVCFRVLDIACGLGMAAGSAALAARLAGPRAGRVAFSGALLLGLRMTPAPLSPDLLLACLIAWYAVAAVGFASQPTPRRAALVGLLGGLSYLAKTYALAFVVAHLATLGALGLVVLRQSTLGRLGRYLPITAAALLLLAGPWVWAISAHDGQPTVGSVGPMAVSFAARAAAGVQQPWQPVRQIRPGRLTAWENPVELEGRKGGVGPAPSRTLSLGWIALRNVRLAADCLRVADGVGLLVLGTLISAVLLVLGWRSAPTADHVARTVLVTAVAIYVGGYLPVWVEMRYYWPTWGLMLALTIDGIWNAGHGTTLTERGASASRDEALGFEGPGARLRAVVLAMLVVGVTVQSLGAIAARHLRGEFAAARALRKAGRALGPGPHLVSNRWEAGVFAAYWSKTPFLGQLGSREPPAIARELAPVAPARLLIFDDGALARDLDETAGFRRIATYSLPDGPVALLEYAPVRAGGRDHQASGQSPRSP